LVGDLVGDVRLPLTSGMSYILSTIQFSLATPDSLSSVGLFFVDDNATKHWSSATYLAYINCNLHTAHYTLNVARSMLTLEQRHLNANL